MFKDIPVEFWPRKEDHVEYPVVYRATRSVNCLRESDFLPTHIEQGISKLVFRKLSDYSVSVSSNLDSLKETVNRYEGLRKKIKSYSKGFTSIERGVSLRESSNHHIDYFLYDYERNNPKDDFAIIEVV